MVVLVIEYYEMSYDHKKYLQEVNAYPVSFPRDPTSHCLAIPGIYLVYDSSSIFTLHLRNSPGLSIDPSAISRVLLSYPCN